MKPYEERRARERQVALAGTRKDDLVADRPQGSSEAGRTVEKLASTAGVGARSVTRAIAVRESGIPELNKKVAAGEITVNEAEHIAMLKLKRWGAT